MQIMSEIMRVAMLLVALLDLLVKKKGWAKENERKGGGRGGGERRYTHQACPPHLDAC
jgi:hypothetical protein